MTKIRIDTRRTASGKQGRLRGALTSQEIAKYVEYCLKPGKAPGPDKCPNELLKTMSDEEFFIVQAWVNEILTLPDKTINTAWQSRSNMNGTIYQLLKGGSTNRTSDPRPVVLLNNGYQLHKYIINERLKRIVEQTNVLEQRQGGGKQGWSVNINMQTMHFVTHKAHRQGKQVYWVDIDFKTPSMQCGRQLSGTWWTCCIYQTLTYWSRFTTAKQSVWLQTTQKVQQSRLIQM